MGRSMTRDEVKKILIIMQVTFKTYEPDNKTQETDVWYIYLKDFTYEEAEAALKVYVATENTPYAPSPSQLIGQINKLRNMALPNEVDIWREVRPAIRNGLYHFQEEYDKLSDTAKKMVGDPQQLREWAMLPSEDIDTVVQSNFKSRFNAMQKRDKELNAMPMEIRQMIESSVKQIGVAE